MNETSLERTSSRRARRACGPKRVRPTPQSAQKADRSPGERLYRRERAAQLAFYSRRRMCDLQIKSRALGELRRTAVRLKEKNEKEFNFKMKKRSSSRQTC